MAPKIEKLTGVRVFSSQKPKTSRKEFIDLRRGSWPTAMFRRATCGGLVRQVPVEKRQPSVYAPAADKPLVRELCSVGTRLRRATAARRRGTPPIHGRRRATLAGVHDSLLAKQRARVRAGACAYRSGDPCSSPHSICPTRRCRSGLPSQGIARRRRTSG